MEPFNAAIIYGQYGKAADPINLPHFAQRLVCLGGNIIMAQHYETQRAYDFLRSTVGLRIIVGASLGAGIAQIIAGYLKPQRVAFVGGFQPSDWDPVMHTDSKTGLRCVTVPSNVTRALCFRNPNPVETAGLGHATYVAEAPSTRLDIIEREDAHPGDFGEAQDLMVKAIMEVVRGNT